MHSTSVSILCTRLELYHIEYQLQFKRLKEEDFGGTRVPLGKFRDHQLDVRFCRIWRKSLYQDLWYRLSVWLSAGGLGLHWDFEE